MKIEGKHVHIYTYIYEQTLGQKLQQENKEGYYMMLKTSTYQEDITITNIYVPKKGHI